MKGNQKWLPFFCSFDSMNELGPIGVFDSGYGGLTILKEFKKYLPNYSFIYFGDNARAPYGTRSFDVVHEYTLQAVNELFSQGCPLVILACNTASAKALRTIQQDDLGKLDPTKRVLGVIRPSTELIGNFTKSKKVGVLATEGTVKSNSYVIEIGKFSPEIDVFQHACPMWVPLIENGEHLSQPGKEFIREDVEKLLKLSPGIDTILLGCTHYPVVEDYIKSLVGEKVQVISQGEIVAKSLADYLTRHPEMEKRIVKESKIDYYTSGDPESFNEKALEFVGLKIESKRLKL